MSTKIATILILACKLTDSPKASVEIMKCTRVTQKEIKRFYKRIAHLVPNLAVVGQSSGKYVEQASENLELSEQTTMWCKQTAENIQSTEVLTGKKPATIAGVALWVILKRIPAEAKKRSLPFDLANTLQISEAAIKAAYREVEPIEKSILPSGINL